MPKHPGRCRQLHGHSYRLEVTIEGEIGDDGMVMDFDDLSEAIAKQLLSVYDHAYLNDVLDNPTAEHLALDSYQRLTSGGLNVVRVTLWETENSSVTITRPEQ